QGRGRADEQGPDPLQEARPGAGGPLQRARGHGRLPAADRELSAAGAGLRAGQAVRQHRGDVERGARLHQPIGQRRTGDRRRHRPVRLVQPARQLPRDRGHTAGDRRAVSGVLAHEDAAPVGRHRRRHARSQPDHRQDAGREPVHQLRLGYRGLQGDPGLRSRVRAHGGQGRAAPDRGAVRPRSLLERPPGRRARRGRRGPLRNADMAKVIARPPTGDLYEEDFPLWAERQAALLRARRFEELDLENLIEEVEDLSRRERETVESHVETIVEHLLKLELSKAKPPRRGWLVTIDKQRAKLARKLTTTLRNHLQTVLPTLYAGLRRPLARQLAKDGVPPEALPPECPYTLEQILDPEWVPVNVHGIMDPAP